MLRIYYADVSALPEEPEGLPLSSFRLTQLDRLKPALRRRQSIGAELLLIRALRESCGTLALPLTLTVGENGKPSLPEGMPYMNLSHSGAYAACAICDRPVGLDLQELRPCREELLTRLFAQEEKDFVLRAKDRDTAFTELWSKKESFLKAGGQGITVPLSSFSVLDPTCSGHIWHESLGELHLAVCVPDGDPRPELVQCVRLP